MQVNTPISIGELVDKLTILEIKKNKIKSDEKLKSINLEYNSLSKVLINLNLDGNILTPLKNQLLEINLKLWEIEDEIRIMEKNKCFDEKFIETARSVYINNDNRFKVKNDINKKFNSEFKEEKSYEEY